MEVGEKALREFISIISQKFSSRVEEIIVFGSHARGEAEAKSDVDVLVVGYVSLEELIDETIQIC